MLLGSYGPHSLTYSSLSIRPARMYLPFSPSLSAPLTAFRPPSTPPSIPLAYIMDLRNNLHTIMSACLVSRPTYILNPAVHSGFRTV